jgi:RNA recognition motif-containing protein
VAAKLFVGSLSWNVTEDQLRELFATVGTVASASIITDRDSGRSKGFGFVEMSSDEEAKAAIDQLNNKELDGRAINVSEAKPREERPQGGGFRNAGPNQNRGGRDNFSNRRRY